MGITTITLIIILYRFPQSMNLMDLVCKQRDHRDWGEFAAFVCQSGPSPRQGSKSDEAHPPIHPTKCVTNLSGYHSFQSSQTYQVIILSNLHKLIRLSFFPIFTSLLGYHFFLIFTNLLGYHSFLIFTNLSGYHSFQSSQTYQVIILSQSSQTYQVIIFSQSSRAY